MLSYHCVKYIRHVKQRTLYFKNMSLLACPEHATVYNVYAQLGTAQYLSVGGGGGGGGLKFRSIILILDDPPPNKI